MHFPVYLLIPAFSAVVYTVASLFFKRGYDAGAPTLSAFHWSNFIGMVVYAPLFFFPHGPLPVAEWWRPAAIAGLIYLGSWCTFAAIRRGDVSMVTPILGTKVVIVAMAFVLVSGTGLSAGLWLAAILATGGIAVIGKGDLRPGKANGVAMLFCVVSAVFYGVVDVLISCWATENGGTAFLAAIPQFLGCFSLLTVPFSKEPLLRLTPPQRTWVVAGSVLGTVQGMGLAITLAFFNDPTGVNIVYSTRGLWAIVLVWGLGHWFANRERERAGRSVMICRLAGTVLITAGVVIAVVERAGLQH